VSVNVCFGNWNISSENQNTGISLKCGVINLYIGSGDNTDSKVMAGEGDIETPSSSKYDSTAGLAIPRVVKFGYREFVLT